jgi:hypothetical protein
MNIDNLRNSSPKLLSYMTSAGYSRNYIRFIERAIEIVLDKDARWQSYDDILSVFTKDVSKSEFSKRKAVINIVASFDYYDVLPCGRLNPSYFPHLHSYDYLNAEFKALVDEYFAIVDWSHKKSTTIRNECLNVSSFLLSLQNAGCRATEEVAEKDVLSVFTDASGYPNKSASYSKQIATVFKKLAEQNGECRRIMLFIPNIRKHRKNIQYLTTDERAKIKFALKDKENGLVLQL